MDDDGENNHEQRGQWLGSPIRNSRFITFQGIYGSAQARAEVMPPVMAPLSRVQLIWNA